MKVITLILSAFIASPFALFAATPKEQVTLAQKEARAQKKDILMIFSGAKWQQESQEFDKTILKSEVFQKGVEKDFVQVVIDCPRQRAEAHKELLTLQQTYRFREMPSVVLTDFTGRPYAYTGLREKEPAAYLKHLAEFHKLRVERDRLFAEAKKAKGVERAKLIIKGLEGMPQSMIRDFYAPELTAIVKADPKGETSYVEEIEKAEDLRNEQERFGMLLRNRKYEEVIKSAKEKGAKLKGEDAQRLKVYEIQALAAQKKFDEALKEVEAMAKLAPDSKYGKQSESYLASLKSAKTRSENVKKAKMAPKKATKPIVSKPVAIVSDINALKKDAKDAEAAAAKAIAEEEKLKKAHAASTKKITEMEAELKKLRESQKADSATLKKVAEDRDKLARRAQALKEVVENHEAMAKRKRDISDLEKKAADLQKQAEALRKQAEEIQKGK